MRTTTGPEDTVLSASTYQVSHRLKVANGSGTMKDWSSWTEDVDTDENIDQPIEQITVLFRRDFGITLSLNPLKTDSTLNVLDDNVTFSPAIDVGRVITWETATTPIGTAPVSGDWKPLFNGTIDDLDFDKSPMQAVCRDKGGKVTDAWVETEVAYPAISTLEAGIQRVLDARFGAGVIPLFTPVSPGYALNAYKQQIESCANAVDALEQLTGWDVRYMWDNGSSAYRYTLWDPGRSKTIPDYTFGPSRILGVKKLGFQKRSVRNVIIVSYKDITTGLRQFITVSDATSITRYDRQVLFLLEADDSPINNSTQATTMANSALADLKDPKAEFEVEMFLWWPAMLNDLYRFTANIRHFNTNQDWAVVGIKHRITMGVTRTTLVVRGKPTGGYDSWLNRKSVQNPTPLPTIPDYHGAFFYEGFDKTPTQQQCIAASGTSGTLVQAAGVSAVGKNVYQFTAYEWWTYPFLIPFNPSKLYRIRSRYRCTVNPGTAGTRLIYIGLQCYDASGAVTNNNGGYNYVGSSGVSVNVASGWVEQTSWFKGATSAFGSGSTSSSADPLAPSTLSVNTVLVKPQFAMNYPSGGTTDGTFQLDYITIEEFDEDVSFRGYNVIDILGRIKRGKVWDDGNYGHVSTTSDGLTLHTSAKDSGLRLINKHFAKANVADPDNLDSVPDGSTYAKPFTTRINAGRPWIDFSEPIHSGKHLGNIADDAGSNRNAATTNEKTGAGRAFAALDGNNRAINIKRLPMTNSGGVRSLQVSNPLSAVWNGGTSKYDVTIAAHTLRSGATDVLYSSGTIAGLNTLTSYFIYADDNAYGGGAVTYVAVTNNYNLTGSDDRYFVGYITTGGTGGSATSNPGGGACFPAGTMISTPYGSIAIDLIGPGEKVLSFDDEGNVRVAEVEAVIIHVSTEILEIDIEGGKSLSVTPEHLIFQGAGVFVAARDLRPRDRIYHLVNDRLLPLEIRSIIHSSIKPTKVFNLTVRHYATYFADRVAVHNVKAV